MPTVTISDATPVLEADGAQLEFALTASDGTLDGQTVTITYDTADEAGLTQNVLFTGTAGILTIDVVNDDEADGDDTVTVTLTGASGDALVDATPASGIVTEDDESGLPKGDVVFAVNAGGPAVTTSDGVTYEASTGFTGVVGTFGGTNTVDYTGDGVDDVDDTVYETEVYGGKGAAADLVFTRGGPDPGRLRPDIEIRRDLRGRDRRARL